MRVTLRLFAAATLVFLAGFVPADHAGAQPPPIDHYKVYHFDSPRVGGAVILRDQFGESQVQFDGPWRFGLPTDKNTEGVRNLRDHLTWYQIFDHPQPQRRVVVDNQFGEAALDVFDSRFMLVPALKNASPAEPHDPLLDHFKCYDAAGQPTSRTVTLQTQFGNEVVEVLHPRYLCNPAEKQIPGGPTFPIKNDRDHLVCYIIDPQHPLNITINYRDQFVSQGNGILLQNNLLCVPSLKTGVTDSENSTWGRLKSIYR